MDRCFSISLNSFEAKIHSTKTTSHVGSRSVTVFKLLKLFSVFVVNFKVGINSRNHSMVSLVYCRLSFQFKSLILKLYRQVCFCNGSHAHCKKLLRHVARKRSLKYKFTLLNLCIPSFYKNLSEKVMVVYTEALCNSNCSKECKFVKAVT